MPKPRKRQVPRRQNNRQQALLNAAAKLFKAHGFEAISIRDISSQSGMLPGSVYYHFPSKDELLAAVYRSGLQHCLATVRAAIQVCDSPMQQLSTASRVHLHAILDNDPSAVFVRILPRKRGVLFRKLVGMRDQYENVFRDLVNSLPLARNVDATLLRLTLLGALNYVPVWYHKGSDDPDTVADQIVQRIFHGSG